MSTNGVATKKDVKVIVDKLEKKLENRIVESEVKILGELQKMRDDNVAHQFSHQRINDEIQDHEKRLDKLESV